MTNVKKIKIATEWSRSPTGRYRADGPSNGTDFRNRLIIPFINSTDQFIIDLDGTDGYGSSFLDEAFAGLVRAQVITKEKFSEIFTFISTEDPSFPEEIFMYVGDVD